MKKHASDIIGIIGLVTICLGVYMINQAAAIITGGIFTIIVSYAIHQDSLKGGSK